MFALSGCPLIWSPVFRECFCVFLLWFRKINGTSTRKVKLIVILISSDYKCEIRGVICLFRAPKTTREPWSGIWWKSYCDVASVFPLRVNGKLFNKNSCFASFNRTRIRECIIVEFSFEILICAKNDNFDNIKYFLWAYTIFFSDYE